MLCSRPLSLLAIFGLIAVSTVHAGKFSGDVQLIASLKPQLFGQNNIDLSKYQSTGSQLDTRRIRLDYTGQYSRNYSGFIRAQLDEMDNSQFKIITQIVDPALYYGQEKWIFSQVYTTLDLQANNLLKVGLIQAPNVTMEREDYQLGINTDRIGAVIGNMGNHLGISLEGLGGPFSFNLGVWDQTSNKKITSISPVSEVITPFVLKYAVSPDTNLDTTEVQKSIGISNFDTKNSLKMAAGGRVTYTPYLKQGNGFGFGLGYSKTPLNEPIALAVLNLGYVPGSAAVSSGGVVTTPAQPAIGDYRLTTFNNVENIKLDFTVIADKLQINMGYGQRKLPLEDQATIVTQDTTGGTPYQTPSSLYIFDTDGRMYGGYFETAYMILGKGYRYDLLNAMIKGVRLYKNKPGLELGLRLGGFYKKNLCALLDQRGASDFFNSTYYIDPSNPSSSISGNGRLNYAPSKQGENESLVMVALDNDVADLYNIHVKFVYPETKTEKSMFGFGSDKTVVNSYAIYQKGFSIHLNYYFTEKISLKAEFEQLRNKKRIYGQDSYFVDSIYEAKKSNFRFMFESKF